MLSSGTEHMSAEEYREYLSAQSSNKTNKYKSRTLWYDGLLFRSKKELTDYLDHKRLLRAGEIAGFLWQGVLVLVEGGSSKEEKAVVYVPDIVVLKNDGTYEIREDKGKRTKDYIIKHKIIKHRYPKVCFREV